MLASRAAAAVTTVVCVYLALRCDARLNCWHCRHRDWRQALRCDARLRHGHDGGADRVSGGVATAGVRRLVGGLGGGRPSTPARAWGDGGIDGDARRDADRHDRVAVIGDKPACGKLQLRT